jgi:hypothetical protein
LFGGDGVVLAYGIWDIRRSELVRGAFGRCRKMRLGPALEFFGVHFASRRLGSAELSIRPGKPSPVQNGRASILLAL